MIFSYEQSGRLLFFFNCGAAAAAAAAPCLCRKSVGLFCLCLEVCSVVGIPQLKYDAICFFVRYFFTYFQCSIFISVCILMYTIWMVWSIPSWYFVRILHSLSCVNLILLSLILPYLTVISNLEATLACWILSPASSERIVLHSVFLGL